MTTEGTTSVVGTRREEGIVPDEALLRELRELPIFATLTEPDLRCLGDLEMLHLPTGEVIVEQGEKPMFFCVLLQGTLELYETSSLGREMRLLEFGPGFTFGELALLGGVPASASLRTTEPSRLLRLGEASFWRLLTTCPQIRHSILENLTHRLQKMQLRSVQQEKMASLGTMAAGLMHELNNPGAAAKRAASQLRENLLRMHHLSAKFTRTKLTEQQKICLWEMQEQALSPREPVRMNSLEQSDAEEALAEWMEAAQIEDAWKLAPTLVGIGLSAAELECARHEFPGDSFADALSWLEAMVSSLQLVGTIEDSIGRVSDLVRAVKSYVYEGKGQRQVLDVNESLHATLVMLGHKLREKQVVLEKDLAPNLPPFCSMYTGLNQIWTNLLDNAIDAVGQGGRIQVKTWLQKKAALGDAMDICVRVVDNGSGIPPEIQPHIFDPFYTTKEAGVGTGLGLGIVHKLIDQFGGAIHFSSVPGETEFVVRLPAAAAVCEAPAEAVAGNGV